MTCDCPHFKKRLSLSRTVRQLLGFPFGSRGSWLRVGRQVRAESCPGAGRLRLTWFVCLVLGDFVVFGRVSRTHAHDVKQVVVAQHPRASGQPLFFFERCEAVPAISFFHAKGLAAAS